MTGHDDVVASVAVGRAGDRDIIITGSGDSTARIWDAVTGAQSANLSSATTDR
jgi:WD40 repeat protein